VPVSGIEPYTSSRKWCDVRGRTAHRTRNIVDTSVVTEILTFVQTAGGAAGGVAGAYILLIAIFSFLSLRKGPRGSRARKILALLVRSSPKDKSG